MQHSALLDACVPGIAAFRRRGAQTFAEPFQISVTVRRVINFTFL